MCEKNENLRREVRIRASQADRIFNEALQREDYELCGGIKAEMDRRLRLFLEDTTTLENIFENPDKPPSEEDFKEEPCFPYVFDKYFTVVIEKSE